MERWRREGLEVFNLWLHNRMHLWEIGPSRLGLGANASQLIAHHEQYRHKGEEERTQLTRLIYADLSFMVEKGCGEQPCLRDSRVS